MSAEGINPHTAPFHNSSPELVSMGKPYDENCSRSIRDMTHAIAATKAKSSRLFHRKLDQMKARSGKCSFGRMRLRPSPARRYIAMNNATRHPALRPRLPRNTHLRRFISHTPTDEH